MNIQSCCKCREVPQNILRMDCGDNICLECAAIKLGENRREKEDCLVCDICGKTTRLDKQTIYELEKVLVRIKVDNDDYTRQQIERHLSSHNHVHSKYPFSDGKDRLDYSNSKQKQGSPLNSVQEYSNRKGPYDYSGSKQKEGRQSNGQNNVSSWDIG